MGIEIPGYLQWVSYLAGEKWPEGDETAMFRLGDVWASHADQLRDLIPDLDAVTQETLSVIVGQSAQAIEDQFVKMFSGDYAVSKLADGMDGLGALASNTGTQIQYTKYNIIASLAVAAVEIAWALASSWATWGASLATIPITQAITRAATAVAQRILLKAILRKLAESVATSTIRKLLAKEIGHIAMHVMREAIEETIVGAAQELAVQGLQVAQGTRDGINGKQLFDTTWQSGLGGAIGGATNLGFRGASNRMFGNPAGRLDGAFRGGVGGYLSGLAGNGGTMLVAGGEFTAAGFFGGAATSGVTGGIRGGAPVRAGSPSMAAGAPDGSGNFGNNGGLQGNSTSTGDGGHPSGTPGGTTGDTTGDTTGQGAPSGTTDTSGQHAGDATSTNGAEGTSGNQSDGGGNSRSGDASQTTSPQQAGVADSTSDGGQQGSHPGVHAAQGDTAAPGTSTAGDGVSTTGTPGGHSGAADGSGQGVSSVDGARTDGSGSGTPGSGTPSPGVSGAAAPGGATTPGGPVGHGAGPGPASVPGSPAGAGSTSPASSVSSNPGSAPSTSPAQTSPGQTSPVSSSPLRSVVAEHPGPSGAGVTARPSGVGTPTAVMANAAVPQVGTHHGGVSTAGEASRQVSVSESGGERPRAAAGPGGPPRGPGDGGGRVPPTGGDEGVPRGGDPDGEDSASQHARGQEPGPKPEGQRSGESSEGDSAGRHRAVEVNDESQGRHRASEGEDGRRGAERAGEAAGPRVDARATTASDEGAHSAAKVNGPATQPASVTMSGDGAMTDPAGVPRSIGEHGDLSGGGHDRVDGDGQGPLGQRADADDAPPRRGGRGADEVAEHGARMDQAAEEKMAREAREAPARAASSFTKSMQKTFESVGHSAAPPGGVGDLTHVGADAVTVGAVGAAVLGVVAARAIASGVGRAVAAVGRVVEQVRARFGGSAAGVDGARVDEGPRRVGEGVAADVVAADGVVRADRGLDDVGLDDVVGRLDSTNESGRQCGRNAVAVRELLTSGSTRVPEAMGPDHVGMSVNELAARLGSPDGFSRTDVDAVVRSLVGLGDGSSAVVVGRHGDGSLHAVTVANVGGRLVVIDPSARPGLRVTGLVEGLAHFSEMGAAFHDGRVSVGGGDPRVSRPVSVGDAGGGRVFGGHELVGTRRAGGEPGDGRPTGDHADEARGRPTDDGADERPDADGEVDGTVDDPAAAARAENRQRIETVVVDARAASAARVEAEAELARAREHGDDGEIARAENRLDHSRADEREAHARMWSEVEDHYKPRVHDGGKSYARNPGGEAAGYPLLRPGEDGLPVVVSERVPSESEVARRQELADALDEARADPAASDGTDPAKIVEQVRDEHRQQLREEERRRYSAELGNSDTDTASRDDPANDLTYRFDLDTERVMRDGIDPQELSDQIDAQRHGMETRSINELIEAIDTYNSDERESTTALRSSLREAVEEMCLETLVGAGFDPDTAGRLASAYARVQLQGQGSDQVVTHNHDQVMGGRRSAQTYGDSGVNGMLGAINKQERAAFRAWLEARRDEFGSAAIYVEIRSSG